VQPADITEPRRGDGNPAPLVKHEFGLSEQYKTPDSLPMNWLN